MTGCMGGWCAKRDKCPHYGGIGPPLAERLCLKGVDGVRLIDASQARVIKVDVFTGRELAEVERAG